MKKNRFKINSETGLSGNENINGERLETKVKRITINKEPISDNAPLIYTDRKDGVLPGYNIRTDRFEIAVDAMDKVHKSNQAKRDNIAKMEVVKDNNENGVQSTDGTNGDNK